MTHNIGPMIPYGVRIGPGSGTTEVSPGVWEHTFRPVDAVLGGRPRFVILHFTSPALPGTDRIEIDIGYGRETFTAASGASFWTRPIDPVRFDPIRIRYVGGGPGGVTLTEYGSGQPTITGTPGAPAGSQTNPDVFLHTSPYVEPIYETRVRCGPTFDWQNAACAAPGSIQEQVARAVCVYVRVHEHAGHLDLSTCTGTLIGPDLVLTANHCVGGSDDLAAGSASVCFDFQTDCAGGRPAGYAPTFHKVKRVLQRGSSADWAILQIETPPGGLGITPRSLRTTSPMSGETVFAIHHPHGAVKKLQSTTLGAGGSSGVSGLDYAGGSSGSALFDLAGNLVGGALCCGSSCSVSYPDSRTILNEIGNPPAPSVPYDLMLVIDRSGSMAAPGTSMPGRTKMDEAKDAASLFVQMVRLAGGDRVGLVSFSTAATRPADAAPVSVSAGSKSALIGGAPFTGGIVGALMPGGMTSIGDGLDVALNAITPPSGSNRRAILLMTDGLQNTAPMIETVEPMLGDTRIYAIGFGQEWNLNGALLTRLARDHEGIYMRAHDGLALKKFYALAFGNIFEAGMLADPEGVLRKNESQQKLPSITVCGESTITLIIGWDNPRQPLSAYFIAPNGARVDSGSAGVTTSSGLTWFFLRVPLPYAGAQDGTWSIMLERAPVGPLPAPHVPEDVRYFSSVIADGGARLEPLRETRRFYTGDTINPCVGLYYADRNFPEASIELTVSAPDESLGDLVTQIGLQPPPPGADVTDARQYALQRLEQRRSGAPLRTRTETFPLFDDGLHDDGALETDGIHGGRLLGLTRFEGNYTFHARATYGHGSCSAMREAFWSVYVDCGIDPSQTTVEITGVRVTGSLRTATLVIRPRDSHKNAYGPGRAGGFTVSAQAGVELTSAVRDAEDGSYQVDVAWNPSVTRLPGILLSQPEREPVKLTPAGDGEKPGCWYLIGALLRRLMAGRD